MNRVALPDPEFEIQLRAVLIRCGTSYDLIQPILTGNNKYAINDKTSLKRQRFRRLYQHRILRSQN